MGCFMTPMTLEEVADAVLVIRTTLMLNGWVAVSWGKPMRYWGMSKRGVGSITENAWDKNHGPTTTPLLVAPWVRHEQEPGSEIPWDQVPAYSIYRFYNEAVRQGWL